MVPAILLSALIQSLPQNSASTSSITKLVAALDANYLYASGAAWQQTRSVLLAEESKNISSVDRALERLNDPDLRVVTAEQLQTIQQETAGHERGIGLVDFALTSDPASGKPQIVTTLVGSPGYLAGLQPRDTLTAIDGKSTAGLNQEEVMAALRGQSGSVDLTLERGGVTRKITVPREAQDIKPILFQKLYAENKPVGYIAVRLFTADSGKQVRDAVHELTTHGVDRFVIDLRNNPGGYLDAMATAGSAFTASPLGWKVRRDDTREPISSLEAPLSSARLVVLVNAGTASAAEALAAALHDIRNAVLVGSPTFGRGQIQTYVSLNEAEGIIVPAATIESPSGHRFNKRAGLKPDYKITSTGDEFDGALLKALELLAT